MIEIKKNPTVNPNTLDATKWYVDKLKEELNLVKPRSSRLIKEDLTLPSDFIKRQCTDIIGECIRKVQSLYCWEKNNYFGIIYREECFNDLINNKIKNSYTKKSIEESVTEKSTIEHVIPVSVFKDNLFNYTSVVI